MRERPEPLYPHASPSPRRHATNIRDGCTPYPCLALGLAKSPQGGDSSVLPALTCVGPSTSLTHTFPAAVHALESGQSERLTLTDSRGPDFVRNRERFGSSSHLCATTSRRSPLARTPAAARWAQSVSGERTWVASGRMVRHTSRSIGFVYSFNDVVYKGCAIAPACTAQTRRLGRRDQARLPTTVLPSLLVRFT